MRKLHNSHATFVQQLYNKDTTFMQDQSNAVKKMRIAKKQAHTIESIKPLLANIGAKISSDDKLKCSEKTKISVYTINKYFRGDILNISTAEKLLDYFMKVIARRSAKFEQASELINA